MDANDLMMVAVARVDRGAARLDAWRSDWRELIDLDLFDLEDGRACIMGQIAEAMGLVDDVDDCDEEDCEGDWCRPDASAWYLAGLRELEMSTEDGQACGFDRERLTVAPRVTYDMLETAWRAAITNNR